MFWQNLVTDCIGVSVNPGILQEDRTNGLSFLRKRATLAYLTVNLLWVAIWIGTDALLMKFLTDRLVYGLLEWRYIDVAICWRDLDDWLINSVKLFMLVHIYMLLPCLCFIYNSELNRFVFFRTLIEIIFDSHIKAKINKEIFTFNAWLSLCLHWSYVTPYFYNTRLAWSRSVDTGDVNTGFEYISNCLIKWNFRIFFLNLSYSFLK